MHMMAKHLPQKSDTQLPIYQTESGDTKIEVRLFLRTVQNKMHCDKIGVELKLRVSIDQV
jgi:hypothetical protein